MIDKGWIRLHKGDWYWWAFALYGTKIIFV